LPAGREANPPPPAVRKRRIHDVYVDPVQRMQPFGGEHVARRALRHEAAAAEQRVPGHSEVIEYEDAKGKWHTETAGDSDRPETDVEDS